jgi:hypothetical protein
MGLSISMARSTTNLMRRVEHLAAEGYAKCEIAKRVGI